MGKKFSSLLKRIVPPFILNIFEGRSEAKKIASNTGWLIFDTLTQILTNLFVGVWLARYLGPEQRGIMNLAQSLLAIFVPISALGLGEIFVREIVKESDAKNEIFGSAFVLQAVGYIFFFPIIIGTIFLIRPGDSQIQTAVFILALGNLFSTARIFNWWYSSQLKSKYVVWVTRIVEFVIAGLKIILILAKAPLMIFIGVLAIQPVFFFIGKLLVYNSSGEKVSAWRFNFQRAKALLHDSWPLAFAFIAVTIYTEVDNLMVGQMLTYEDVGIYGEATRISKLWYFIPAAIATSAYPALIRSYQKLSLIDFKKRYQQFLDVLGIIGYVSAVPASIFATSVMTLLYGVEYSVSGEILAIHVWTFLFVAFRYGIDRWLMIQNHTHITVISVAFGLFVNIVLNYLLIPIYGVHGAAWATLISNITAIYLPSMLIPELRLIFYPLIRALFVPFRAISLISKQVRRSS